MGLCLVKRIQADFGQPALGRVFLGVAPRLAAHEEGDLLQFFFRPVLPDDPARGCGSGCDVFFLSVGHVPRGA